MVGERFGLMGRVVEDEGEEGDFSRGMGKIWPAWRVLAMLGIAGICGRITVIRGIY